jgi:serine protease Do
MRKLIGMLTVLLFCGSFAMASTIQDLEREITQISDKSLKSVAFIKVSKTMRGGPGMDPFWDMLRDFGFRGDGRQFNPQQEGLGTGFVIDAAEGYLVTNNHVIDGADKIEVTINKKTFAAKLVGTDPKTDIWPIRIR